MTDSKDTSSGAHQFGHNHGHRLISTTVVPNWMVQLAVWSIGTLGVGAAGIISTLVWWAIGMEGRMARTESNMTILTSSIVTMGSKIDRGNDGIQQLLRDVDVLKAREKP